MKLSSIFLAAASAARAVSAQTATPLGGDLLAAFKASPTTDAYHMAPVRVVHARVQSDSPILVEGQLVSSFGGGKLDAGYLASLDSVNTGSVEGALMYVQAESIDINLRDASQRCIRKQRVQQVIFYEILIAQTNETIAQFQDSWATSEYGPMIAMDGGRCSPTDGDKLPVECYQFNGENEQPNLGPFVGALNWYVPGRAPYPGNYWFSFPNSCPTVPWSKKTDDCRSKTRKGLCPVGVAPNGVECTFAYNILGWVPIDDIVGITSIEDPATGTPYKNFTAWCQASTDNIEFAYSFETEEVQASLPFWKDPLSPYANAGRTQKMLDAYNAVLTKGSTQVDPKLLAAFKALPTPEQLAKVNPPCFKSVKSCGSGTGCKRTGYSQLCMPCAPAENCPTTDGTFQFPTLVKAATTLSEAETQGPATLNSRYTSTSPSSSGAGSSNSALPSPPGAGSSNSTLPSPPGAGSSTSSNGSSAATVPIAIGGSIAVVIAVAALFIWRRRNSGATKTNSKTSSGTGSSDASGTDAAFSLWTDGDLLAVKVSVNDIQDVKMLGSGAFADVWLVRFCGTQLMASKRLRTSDVTRQQTQAFVNEIKLVAALKHPSIVEFIGAAWVRESDLQALFEYMDNGDVRSYLSVTSTATATRTRSHQWTLEKLQIAVDVAEALVYVHSFLPPLVHRDLKSRNVLLNAEMRAKLTDFGVSRYKSGENTMTTGVGTGRWLAPEVIVGDGTYGSPADVFSFGVLLSELDTHQLPYADALGATANKLPEVMLLQLVSTGALTPTISASCPTGVAELARQCFSLDPTKRPSAPEIAFALRKVQKIFLV